MSVTNRGMTTFRRIAETHPSSVSQISPPFVFPCSDAQVGFQNLQNMIVAFSGHFDAEWLLGDLHFIGQGRSSFSSEGLDMFVRHFIPVFDLVS